MRRTVNSVAASLFDGTETQNQWQLHRMQLINWGTFDGVAEAYFVNDFSDAAVTVISGASGTGKSTLQDAYDEIMMRAPRFNAASNVGGRGAGSGYASGKRTLHTYARGMLDSVYDEVAQAEVARVLRDGSCARWTAIGASFVDALGDFFTAAKLYYLVPGSDSVDTSNTWFLTANELLDLSLLEQVANRKFDKRSIAKALPGVRQHFNRSEFLDCVYRTLGIGDERSGRSLVELLARIRSGKDFKTVSALFNELVLDKPKTYEHADKAIEEFDNHSWVHEQMLQTLEQRQVLEPVVGRKASFDEATALHAACESIGGADDQGSPLAFWMRQRRAGLVAEISGEVQVEQEASQARLAEARRHVAETEALVKQLAAQIEEAGGRQVQTLESRIEAARREKAARAAELELLERRLSEADVQVPSDAASFAALQEEARSFSADYGELKAALDAERDGIAVRASELGREASEARADLDYYQSHRGNIPRELAEARDAMARVVGMDSEELPFAGELMELHEGEEGWRDAVETCLHGLSRTVLVERGRYDELSCAIDSVRLDARIRFCGVDVSDTSRALGRDDGIAGKLDLDEKSPFAPWLSRTLADEEHDALCVERAAELRGSGLRITRAGQMRSGFRGSHGRFHDARNAIGFTNEETVARLVERLEQLDAEERRLAGQRDGLEQRRHAAEARSRAFERLLEISFSVVDVDGAEAQLATLERELAEFLKGNTQLADLREQHVKAEERKKELVKREGAEEDRLERLQGELAALHGEADDLVDAAVAAELPDEQVRHIEVIAVEKAAAYPSAREMHASFALFERAVDDENRRMADEAARRAEGDRQAIERAFARFQSRWYDPSRGQTMDSYEDYAAILAEIERQGIDEQEALWKTKMTGWIRESLVPLSRSFSLATTEMRDRIDPINAILAELPFGTDGGRLRISLRDKEDKVVKEFRRELERFSGNATVDFDVVDFYNEVKGFVDRMRKDSPERDSLLDRRRHVEISAKASWPEELGREDSYYNSLAGKSGGEVQELVAFILGSALLYCLGAEANSRPVFAPVMLDEGFIKADSRFTARAVSAWKSFGFQLIVATPEDKFQALAPYAAGCVYMTKDARGVSRVSQTRLAQEADAHA